MKTNFEQSLKQSKIFNRITQFREIILYDYYQKKKRRVQIYSNNSISQKRIAQFDINQTNVVIIRQYHCDQRIFL